MSTVNLLRQLHMDTPHYLGMLLWLGSSAWLSRQLGVAWRKLILLYAVALVSWVSPGMLRAVLQPGGAYRGGFSITWAVVAPAVVVPLVYWRHRQTLGALGVSVLLPIPALGAFAKLSCFFRGCCTCEISVAPGVLSTAPQFSALGEPRDPCQLYEALLLLCLGVVFLQRFQHYGSSSRFVLEALSLFAAQRLIMYYYRSGFGAGADARWTPLHHPLAAGVALAVCLLLLVVIRPRSASPGTALLDRLARPWLPTWVALAGLTLLGGITVLLLVRENREDRAVAWNRRAAAFLIKDDRHERAIRGRPATTELCVAASNYNCLSGFFSWPGICRELRAFYLIQQWGERPPYDSWSAAWDLDPYHQRHIHDLVGAYEQTGDVRYLHTAIAHVSYWLALVDEEAGGAVLWPDNVAALHDRAQAWRQLLSVLERCRYTLPEEWKAAVERRLAFYAACAERPRDPERGHAPAEDASGTSSGGRLAKPLVSAPEQRAGIRGRRVAQAAWLVLDEQGGKVIAFLWWLLFCTASVATSLKPGLARPLVAAGSLSTFLALLFAPPGKVWVCLSGIALCVAGGLAPGRGGPRLPVVHRRVSRAALFVFFAGGILLGIRHHWNVVATSRATAQVRGTAEQFLSAWHRGDTAALFRLTAREGLSQEKSRNVLNRMLACLRFEEMPTIEAITWRSPMVARVTFRTTLQACGTGEGRPPRLSGFFEVPGGPAVVRQTDAIRYLILVKKHGRWLVPL